MHVCTHSVLTTDPKVPTVRTRKAAVLIPEYTWAPAVCRGKTDIPHGSWCLCPWPPPCGSRDPKGPSRLSGQPQAQRGHRGTRLGGGGAVWKTCSLLFKRWLEFQGSNGRHCTEPPPHPALCCDHRDQPEGDRARPRGQDTGLGTSPLGVEGLGWLWEWDRGMGERLWGPLRTTWAPVCPSASSAPG